MRLAKQETNSVAARRADEAFSRDTNVKARISGPLHPKMDCASSPDRIAWMDLYVKAGGEVHRICEERVAPLIADSTIAQIADRVFSSRHPELKGRALNLEHTDGDLRIEWMDLYVEYGGRVATVCEEHKCP